MQNAGHPLLLLVAVVVVVVAVLIFVFKSKPLGIILDKCLRHEAFGKMYFLTNFMISLQYHVTSK